VIIKPLFQTIGLLFCASTTTYSNAATDFPAIDLRGYEKVSGAVTTSNADGTSGSVLTIKCADDEHAKLVLTKFLSDEQVLPGVEKTSFQARQWGVGSVRFGGIPLSAYEVKGQGFLAAIRLGNQVLLEASPTRDGLIKTIDGTLSGSKGTAVSEPEVTVPMWLDRWDQHGFRFYCWPGMTPKDQTPETYDFRGDFTFAKNHGVGMVYWCNLNHVMGADGQSDRTAWDWTEGWSKEDGLPVAINVSTLNYDIPSWLANRYRNGMMQPMPDYLGDSMSVANWRGTSGKVGELAYGATPTRDAMLAAIQTAVRHFDKESNVVSWMEPHGEVSQGGDDFMGYGPAADATFRDYLRTRYAGPDEVSRAWFGHAGSFQSWDDIKVPELATFAGWGPDALDLAGTWRAMFSEIGAALPAAWYTPTFDDSAWQAVTAPGDDRDFFLPKKPAFYRRSFDLPADWLAKHPKAWIYLWDLNVARDDKQPPVSIYINGQKVAESPCIQPRTHWMVADATTFLKAGSNQLSLTLPNGYLGYRIYLTGAEPKQYPNLGEGMNTQWVDLVGWRQSVRVDTIRRGTEMIREVDPNRPITLASPYYAADGLKGVAQDYGGEFHDTGFMSGVWADLLPSLMRGSDLPDSLEPGGPAQDLPGFKNYLGLWMTEGIQQVDYFIHIGDVMWHPDIRKSFDENLPLFHLIGKYHLPKADLAFLFSTRGDALTGFPWSNDLNTNLPGGWNCCGLFGEMLGYCPRDAVSESDFARGNAANYKVIIDTNTSIMDDAFIGQIEKYVRGGGVFVTFVNTGRHTPTQPNAWPIGKLTGYQVLTMEKFGPDGNDLRIDPKDPNPVGTIGGLTVQPAPGQQIFTAQDDWMKTPYVMGLRMKKTMADTQDLLLWKDGTVAVGMRQLGKGAIIEFGCKNGGQPWLGLTSTAFKPILKWAGVKTNAVEVALEKPGAQNLRDYFFREYVSNNGLYNISAIWNPSRTDPIKATLTFKDQSPATARDAVTGQELALPGGKLADVALAPLQTRVFLTPRNQIMQVAGDWFDLQRKWWKASVPVTKPFPKPSDPFVRDLDDDWKGQSMADKDASEPLIAASFDDSKWTSLSAGAWNTVPGWKDVKHAMLRRTFTVPKEWDKGRVELWIQTSGQAFSGQGRVCLDGKVAQPWGAESVIDGMDFAGALAPGTSHCLAVEIKDKGQIAGLVADVWIVYVPKPDSSIDLAGVWTTCKDDLFHDTGTVTWPGSYEAHSLWRTINVPVADAGKNVMLATESDRPFQAFVNGTLVQYSGPWDANSRVGINITPWIHFGQDNRIQLVSIYNKGALSRVALDLYDPAVYP
jgi:hypothetical protein